ncbi:hypothetical protein BGW80DRAFT_1372104 [Lactifluus volemus]|nr:hypothetical protein BGW80DRAFT_1372104 [Lactifluus volemus]
MSQTEHRILNLTDEKATNCQDTALQWAQIAAQNQKSKTKFTDSSGPLFAMYCEVTEQEDKQIFEWIKWVDKIVIYMGLLSAATAALLAVTIQDLKQNPQDTSTFYVENIYKLQVAADSNASRPFTPAQPPPFSAPNYAIWTNIFLSMSLFLDVFTGLLAVAIRGYVPPCLLETKSSYLKPQPHYRARMREIFCTELLDSSPTYTLAYTIILSMGFFITGLSIYFFNINRAVFGSFFCCAWLCIITHYSVLRWMKKIKFRSESSVDDGIFKRLFEGIVEDADLLQFLRATPSLCRSSIVRDPVRRVTNLGKENLHNAVKGLLERTWSSPFLSVSEKMWRLVACVNFADAVCLPDVALSILEDIFPLDRHDALRSVEMGQLLRSQGDLTGQPIGLCAQSIVAGIISNVQESNDGWVALAADQLSKREDVIRVYLNHGPDNVLLVNLINITRQIISSLENNRDLAASSLLILPSLSEFDVRNTFPELQDNFRALWNEIKQAPNDSIPKEIHDNLVKLNNALTPNTVDASTTPSHPSDLTSSVHGEANKNVEMHTIVSHPVSLNMDEPSPGNIPDPMQLPTIAAASSSPPRGIQGPSGASQAVASAATATAGNITNTQISEQPTVLLASDPSRVPSAMITNVPSSTTSVSRPRITVTAPLVAHHDAKDMNNPIEMTSLLHARQSDPSAQNHDPSGNPA